MPSKNTSNNVYYVVGLAAYPSARGTVGKFIFSTLISHSVTHDIGEKTITETVCIDHFQQDQIQSAGYAGFGAAT